MKIIGYLPEEKDLFLLDSPNLHGKPAGRVLDVTRKILFPALPLISLTARENWQKYTGDQSILSRLLEGVPQDNGK
jgi:hypothetical protein